MMEKSLEIKRLKRKISEYKKFAIYGIGEYGKYFLEIAHKYDIDIDYIVVSNKECVNRYNDIHIYELDELDEYDDTFFLISVNKKIQQEIIDNLKRKNINDFDVITNYIYDVDQEIEISEQLDDSEWREYVEKSKTDFEPCNVKCSNRISIVLAVADFSPRVIKFAKALMKTNKDFMILMLPNALERSIVREFISENSKYIKRVYCVTEMHYVFMHLQYDLIHLFTHMGHTKIDRTLIRHKALFGKIVFDVYDVANYFYMGIAPEIYEAERYCIENADGICNRGLEYEFLLKKDWNIKGRWLQLHDYCANEHYFTSGNDLELSICYTGGVVCDSDYDVPPPFGHILELADRCEAEKCHFHVYPTNYNEDKYKEYIKYSNEHTYFHFHKPLPYNELVREISRYDYGINMCSRDYMERESSGYNYREKYIYTSTNKVFTYLEAGLPIIAAMPELLMKQLSKFGIAKTWTYEQIKFDWLAKNKKYLKEKVKSAYDMLKFENYIDDLLEFYDDIVSM